MPTPSRPPVLASVQSYEAAAPNVLHALRLTAVEHMSYGAVSVDNGWLELPLTESWTCAMRLAVQEGAVVIAEIRVFPAEAWDARPVGAWSGCWLGVGAAVPPGGVTARLLRAVSVSQGHRAATRFLQSLRRRFVDEVADLTGPPVNRWWLGGGIRTGQPSAQRRRRPAPSAVFLAEVARRYDAAIRKRSRRPIEEVAAQLNITSKKDASRYVSLARDRGLLTPARKQGKAGGSITARALRLLHPTPRARTPAKETR